MKHLAAFGIVSILGVVWKWLSKIHNSMTFMRTTHSSSNGVRAFVVFDKPRPYRQLKFSDRVAIPGESIYPREDIHRVTIKITSTDSVGINIQRIITRFEKVFEREIGPVGKGFAQIHPSPDEDAPEFGVTYDQNTRTRWVVSYWITSRIPLDALRESIADLQGIEDLSLKEVKCSERSTRHTKRWAAVVMAILLLMISAKAFAPVVLLPLLWAYSGIFIIGLAWLDLVYLHELSTRIWARMA